MNVLLVMRNAQARALIQSAVPEAMPTARVTDLADAREAAAFTARNRVDIAFLELTPADGAIALGRALAEKHPKCNLILCAECADSVAQAWELFCSAYLMYPLTGEKIRAALTHLRYPPQEDARRLELRCFGNFDVLCDGQPVAFRYKKTRELLAYLTDCNGAEATTQEIIAAIFEENKSSYFSNVRLDLLRTLERLGASEAVYTRYGRMRVVREAVRCDYFDYLDGKSRKFYGKYMEQYSFAEETCAYLNKNMPGKI